MSAEERQAIKRYGIWFALWTIVIFPMIVLFTITSHDVPTGSITALLTYMGGLVGGPVGMWIWRKTKNAQSS